MVNSRGLAGKLSRGGKGKLVVLGKSIFLEGFLDFFPIFQPELIRKGVEILTKKVEKSQRKVYSSGPQGSPINHVSAYVRAYVQVIFRSGKSSYNKTY